jgi:hypothetical protein
MSNQEQKIALIGSAPASIRLAPYHDPSWEIWACSPGTYGIIPRCNRFFELHRYEPGQPWFSPEYCQWMAKAQFPVVMAEVRKEIPSSVRLPQEELIAKYDPECWFWTSSLSWMMAMAIEAGATKIGFWGVDMAASEEYEAQRSGIHYFAKLARDRGIEVGAPPESDLFTPRFLYGVDEIRHSSIKVLARRRELEARLAMAANEARNKSLEEAFLRGALDDLKYMGDTWASKAGQLGPAMPVTPPVVSMTAEPKDGIPV